MRTPRFYTSQALNCGDTLLLELPASHHLLRVLRAQCGESVLLFNGDGCEYHATLTGNQGKQASLSIGNKSTPHRESGLHISLGQGISRGERMDLVIQKSVELGVNVIAPLRTRRSQVNLDGKRLEKRMSHWRGIIQAASEQSGRVYLPELESPRSLEQWLETDVDVSGISRIILDPQSEMRIHQIQPAKSVQVLIGPEGGFESREVDGAIAAGFQAVCLGRRILRTETAALAALAAMQTLWGDFANGGPT